MSDNSNQIGLTKAGVVVTDATTGIAQVTFRYAFKKGTNYSVSLSTPDPGVGIASVHVYASNISNIGFTVASYTLTGATNSLVVAVSKTVYWIAVPMFD